MPPPPLPTITLMPLVLAFGIVLLLASCTRVDEAPTAEPTPVEATATGTGTPAPPTVTSVPPTPTPIPPSAMPTPRPIPTTEAEVIVVNEREALIETIPWVEAGLTSPRAFFAHGRLVWLARHHAEVFDAIFKKEWLHSATVEDGKADFVLILSDIVALAEYDVQETLNVLSMPFLETLHENDEHFLNTLRRIYEEDQTTYRKLMQSPTYDEGIPEGRHIAGPFITDIIRLRAPEFYEWLISGVVPGWTDIQIENTRALLFASPQLTRKLIEQSGRLPDNSIFVRSLSELAYADESIALAVIDMPFVRNPLIYYIEVLETLSLMATSNPDQLARLLTHYESQGGITNADRPDVVLGALRYSMPDVYEALSGLPWVADGISPVGMTPGQAGARYPEAALNEDIEEDIERSQQRVSEEMAFFDFVAVSLQGQQGVVTSLASKTWVQDGLSLMEWDVINALIFGYGGSSSAAEQLIEMPFLDTVEIADVGIIRRIWQIQARFGTVKDVLLRPEFSGGITDESGTYVYFAHLEKVSTRAAEAMRLQLEHPGRLNRQEREAAYWLVEIANSDEAVIEAILDRGWIQSGLNEDKIDALNRIARLISGAVSATEREEIREILETPFDD